MVLIVRVLGPAFRIAILITSAVIVIVGSLLTPSLYETASLVRCKSDGIPNFLMGFTFVLWVLCFFLGSASLFLVTVFSSPIRERSRRWWIFGPAFPLGDGEGNMEKRSWTGLGEVLAFVGYFGGFGVNSLAIFIILGNLYKEHLHNLGVLTVLLASYLLVICLEDCTRVGSPYGLQVDSRWGSRLIALRSPIGVFTFVVTISIVAMNFPYEESQYTETVHVSSDCR